MKNGIVANWTRIRIFAVMVFSFIIFSVNFEKSCFANWQGDLETVFDIVETFDQLQDWKGPVLVGSTNPNQMPKKLDGSPSIWQEYTVDDAPKADWIRNHGDGYVWNGTKSLCINYNNLATDSDNSKEILGYGPSRLTTFFGDGISGKSGYKKIHIFYMIKFRDGFFIRNTANDGWEYTNGYLKTIEISSGFTKVNYWGSTNENNLVCDSPQFRTVYGVNATVLNIVGGGLSLKNLLCFYDTTLTTSLAGSCYKYAQKTQTYKSANIASEYSNDKWVGIEIIEDIGTVDKSDGSLTVKVYNDKGLLIGSESFTNQARLVKFDHYYNKVTLGGNKSFFQPCGIENRFYVDDFIINKSEIAPIYFKMLSGGCVTGVKLNKVTNPTVK